MAAARATKTTAMVIVATLRSSCGTTFSLSAAMIFLLFLISTKVTTTSALNDAVLSVKYKYAGREPSLSALKAHDDRRQLRILAGVDLPLGGSGRPDAVGYLFLCCSFCCSINFFLCFRICVEIFFFSRLYYAKIGIGTPPKDYYVQVDTGSDIMWVNCIQCKDCPTRSSLGVRLFYFIFIFLMRNKFYCCLKSLG